MSDGWLSNVLWSFGISSVSEVEELRRQLEECKAGRRGDKVIRDHYQKKIDEAEKMIEACDCAGPKIASPEATMQSTE